MIAILLSLLIQPHGMKKLEPVLISRTGPGVWASMLDARHIDYIRRIRLAGVIIDVKRPDWYFDDGHKAEAEQWSILILGRARVFCHTGIWREDYSYFHGERAKFSKAAKANGFGLIFVDDN